MKKFSVDIKKHTPEIINYENKKMLPLTDEEINHAIIKTFATPAGNVSSS